MQRIFFTVLLMFILTSAAYAAPLMDYSEGKVALDYTYRPDMKLDAKGFETGSSLKDNASEWGITAGLGHNFALQYRQIDPVSAQSSNVINPSPYYGSPYIQQNDYLASAKYHEINLMYKLQNNLSAFAGVVSANFSGSVAGTCVHPNPAGNHPKGPNYSISEDKNIVQVGLIGVTDLSKKSKLYGIASVGKDFHNLEAGISYALNKQLDLNVSYRIMDFKNVATINNNTYGASVDGYGVGITYKF